MNYSGSGEDDLKMTQPHFYIFEIISPLKRTSGPLFEQFKIPFHQG
jgi:hypothetical protein